MQRHLDWEGCFNARDLGGLRTGDGRATRWGAVVRSDAPDRLTPPGWAALEAHGIRTVLDLRNEDEREPDLHARPAGLATVHLPLDDLDDIEFWEHSRRGDLDGTPLYYRPFLERKPERCAAAAAAVARAGPGGVLVHCVGGRDRAGLVSLLVLALAGVLPGEIASDYELSNDRLPALWTDRGWEDQRPAIQAVLERNGTTARSALMATLAAVDATQCLRAAGLADADLSAVRRRLIRA
ncbi:MAG TPA: tyrosine-protein phosphatase [Thermoleophilaceae bacterium]|nr:tyrosine-protein phosphatase [Thermoleophilaceae bacterium]